MIKKNLMLAEGHLRLETNAGGNTVGFKIGDWIVTHLGIGDLDPKVFRRELKAKLIVKFENKEKK